MDKSLTIKAPEKFSIEGSLSEGWECTKREFWPMLGVLILAGILPTSLAIISFLFSLLSKEDTGTFFIWSLVCAGISAIVNVFVEMGLINVQLKVIYGEHARVGDLFSRRGVIINFFLGSLLFGLLKAIGFLCFIIPGIYVMVAFPFYSYFIVDKGMGPIQALKASWVATRGARLDYTLALIVFYFVKMIGGMILLVGAIPAHMIVLFGTAHIYRQLLSRTPVDEFEDMNIGGLKDSDNGPVNSAAMDELHPDALHAEELRRFDAELKKQEQEQQQKRIED